jgi:hypothetical protein
MLKDEEVKKGDKTTEIITMEMDGTSEKVENSTTQDKNDIIIESGKKYENGIKIFEGLSASVNNKFLLRFHTIRLHLYM